MLLWRALHPGELAGQWRTVRLLPGPYLSRTVRMVEMMRGPPLAPSTALSWPPGPSTRVGAMDDSGLRPGSM